MHRFIFLSPVKASAHEHEDKIADSWMPLVLQPAIDHGGMYKPLETLKAMSDIDWEGVGVCKSCAEEKRRDWANEAEVVWEKLGPWLEL
jgi:hypothetical protein